MFRRIRKSRVEGEEIIADAVFLLTSFLITVAALFVFDIHWNLYPGGNMFPPEKYIFQDNTIFVYGGLLGAVLGLLLIKLFLFGLRREEDVWKSNRKPRTRKLK